MHLGGGGWKGEGGALWMWRERAGTVVPTLTLSVIDALVVSVDMVVSVTK